MSSAYLPRNQPQRSRVVDVTLTLRVKKDLYNSDKILLPEFILNLIMREFPNNPPNPTLFEIRCLNLVDLNAPPQLHCGVLEYTSPNRDEAYIPLWMFKCLRNGDDGPVSEGDKMKFILRRGIQKCTYAQFRPLDARFMRLISTPKQTLEHALRLFTVLTDGQRIPIIHDGRIYPLKVEKVSPDGVASLIDTHLQVDFLPYEESLSDATDEKEAQQAMISGEEQKSNANRGPKDYIDPIELHLYHTVSDVSEKDNPVYYKVKVGNPNYPVRIQLKLNSGDANVYVHSAFDQPSQTRFIWCDESDNTAKTIVIQPNDFNFSNWFYVGVHSFIYDTSRLPIDLQKKIDPSLISNTNSQFEIFVDQQDESQSAKSGDNDVTMMNKSGAPSLEKKLGSSVDVLSNKEDLSATHTMCENCGKPIANGAYMMHSLQCARINWKCDICDAVVSRHDKDRHLHCSYLKEYDCEETFDNLKSMIRHITMRHSKIECELCGESLFARQMVSHQKNECLMRSVSCRWCGMDIKCANRDDHQSYCSNLTIECEICGEAVTRKGLENHLASEHRLNPTLQTTLVNTIMRSNLGIDGLNKESGLDDVTRQQMSRAKSLDDADEDVDVVDSREPLADDLIVGDLKRQLSRAVSAPSQMEEKSADDIVVETWDFPCPYCQQHPPKSIPFPEHLETCAEQTMMEDSDGQ